MECKWEKRPQSNFMDLVLQAVYSTPQCSTVKLSTLSGQAVPSFPTKNCKLQKCKYRTFQGALVVKNPPASAGDIRDVSLIPGSRRSSGGGHDNPLQYSCLGNPMDRGAWWVQSMGWPRVGHDSATEHTHTYTRLPVTSFLRPL